MYSEIMNDVRLSPFSYPRARRPSFWFFRAFGQLYFWSPRHFREWHAGTALVGTRDVPDSPCCIGRSCGIVTAKVTTFEYVHRYPAPPA